VRASVLELMLSAVSATAYVSDFRIACLITIA
jgi:hypothetical protein